MGILGSIASWFPEVPKSSDPSEWRLDVVTLLAVIGESSMAEYSQTITASFLCILPRILPAPQALLKPSRPPRMPETPAKMAGVYSGVVLETVGFFANIIQPLDDLPAYSFKAIEVRHRTSGSKARPFLETAQRAITPVPGAGAGDGHGDKRASGGSGDTARATGASNVVAFVVDPEHGGQAPQPGVQRRRTMQQKAADFVTTGSEDKRPAVPVQLWSPVHVLSVFSCVLTLAMIVMAVWWVDGPAIFAVSFVSLASSIVGYASWWEPILMNLSHANELPPGDIVIRTREGAFVYVKCHEGVTRELFSGTEECKYRVGDNAHRLLMGLGTMLLMVSVVLLGNCSCEWTANHHLPPKTPPFRPRPSGSLLTTAALARREHAAVHRRGLHLSERPLLGYGHAAQAVLLGPEPVRVARHHARGRQKRQQEGGRGRPGRCERGQAELHADAVVRDPRDQARRLGGAVRGGAGDGAVAGVAEGGSGERRQEQPRVACRGAQGRHHGPEEGARLAGARERAGRRRGPTRAADRGAGPEGFRRARRHAVIWSSLGLGGMIWFFTA